MAITVTAIGEANNSATLTTWTIGAPLNAVALSTGDSIIVTITCRAGTNPITGITWNAIALTKDRSTTNTGVTPNVTAEVWTLHNVTGATGGIVVTFAASTADGKSVCACKVTGLATASTRDRLASSTGSSTAPNSTFTAATVQANELIFGTVGSAQASGSTDGTWDNSFTTLQKNGTGAITNPAKNMTGYKIVAAIDAYNASKTGMASAAWCAICATYKDAVPGGGGGGVVPQAAHLRRMMSV